MNIKDSTLNILYFYSKFNFRLLADCEFLRTHNKGHSALFSIFLILENIIKSKLNDYESNLKPLIKKLLDLKIINQTEHNFLSNSQNGIRIIRNIFAHANLSKYDLIFEDDETTYPLSENENCILFYDFISEIIFFIILKIIHTDLENNIVLDPNFEEVILGKSKYEIIVRSPEELMRLKGIHIKDSFKNLPESVKYRLVENSSDIKILEVILKNLLK